LKVAVLSTPANVEFAQQFVDRLPTDSDITHYFKRGRLCQKRHKGWEQERHKVLDRLTLFKDIRAERFDHFILVEWPHARTKVLPYYALLAFFSKAARKSMVLQDGTYIPITAELFIHLVRELIIIPIKFAAILPLLLLNFVILTSIAIGVDLICLVRSKSFTGSPQNSSDGS
jgi:hypothetical protein